MTNPADGLEAVGREIAMLRKERGWSQYDLAHHSGVPRGTIAHLENGSHEPRRWKLEAVAKALGVDVNRWSRMIDGKSVDVAADAIDLAALLDTSSPEIRRIVREWMLLPASKREQFAQAVQAMLAALRAK